MANEYIDDSGNLTDVGVMHIVECWQKQLPLEPYLQEHLEGCVECQQEVLEYRLFLESSVHESAPKPEGKTPWLRWAAAVLLLAVAGWFLVNQFTGTGLNQQEIDARVAVLQEEGSLAYWDALLESQDVVRGEEFAFEGPELDEVLIEVPVVFKLERAWVEDITLELFDKSSEAEPVIHLLKKGEQSLSIELTEDGLYYWRMLIPDEAGRQKAVAIGRVLYLDLKE